MASTGTHADTAVIIRFSDPVDHQPLTVTDRRARDNRLLVALKARTRAGPRGDRAVARRRRGAQRVTDLWIINGLAATLPAHAVKRLAEAEGVESVGLDSFVQSGRPQHMPAPRTPPRGAAASPDRSRARPRAGAEEGVPSPRDSGLESRRDSGAADVGTGPYRPRRRRGDDGYRSRSRASGSAAQVARRREQLVRPAR